jgi:hypothetical protein
MTIAMLMRNTLRAAELQHDPPSCADRELQLSRFS